MSIQVSKAFMKDFRAGLALLQAEAKGKVHMVLNDGKLSEELNLKPGGITYLPHVQYQRKKKIRYGKKASLYGANRRNRD